MKIALVICVLGTLLFACFGNCADDRESREQALASSQAAQPSQSAATHSETGTRGDLPALYAKGQTALENGDLDGAEKAFRRVLEVDPNSAGAYSNLGVIAMRRKDWDHALKLLEKAARLAPKVSGIRLNIGLVYYREGDYEAAIPRLSSFLRDQPDSQQARYLLGLCDLFTQRYEGAVSQLEPLWPQKSNDLMYLFVLTTAANGAGQKELEEKALRRLIALGGDSAEFHLLMGKAYLYRQESEQAIAELERAANLNPELPFVHLNLGIAYTRLQENDRAEAEFRKDIQIEPDLPDTYELLGEFYMRAGNESEAEKYFQEALRRSGKMSGSLFGIAKIDLHQGKYAQALESIDAALHLTPENQNAHALRGRILMKMGRRAEAEKELTIAGQMNKASDKAQEPESLGENRVPHPEVTQEPQ